jgi:hypothetical protein
MNNDSFPKDLVPVLQTVVLLACITSITVLGTRGVIDAPAITAIVGAVVGSVGVLAGVGLGVRRNGPNNTPPRKPPSPDQGKGG